MVASRDETTKEPSGPKQPPRTRARWALPAFLIGFLLVFGFMLFFVTLYSLGPAGDAVHAVPLWKFYAAELPRLAAPQRLGPGDAGSGVLTVLVQHLLCSLVGGFASLLLCWLTRLALARLRPRSA